MKNEKRGFTLIELLVVVMIIGILAAIGIPQYLRTVEVSKANDAVPLVVMAGNADRMYALDHSTTPSCFSTGGYVAGGSFGKCTLGSPCLGDCSTPCDLMYCGYMANDDYASKPYFLTIGNCLGPPGTYCSVARVNRQSSASSPYNSWLYDIDSNGVVAALNGAPAPPQ